MAEAWLLMVDLEEFLAQAIRQRKLEAKLTRHALKRLREALGYVRGQIDVYGLAQIGPNRAERIRELRAAVEAYMAENFATPLMQTMQGSSVVEEFVDKQLSLARKVVESTGGTATGALTAKAIIPTAMDQVIINGVPWGEMLTQRLPNSVADKISRMLGLFPDDIGQVYADAVIRPTERHVQAIITSGLQDTGSIAQQMLWQIETSTAWQTDNEQVWSALLDSRVCATCMGRDGKRYSMDYIKQSPHPNCRCVLLPASFFTQDRPVEGDNGTVSEIDTTKKATETWLRKNPSTARAVLGKKISEDFVSGKIGLETAINRAGGT
jgi:hypothetical protein